MNAPAVDAGEATIRCRAVGKIFRTGMEEQARHQADEAQATED